MTTSLIAYASYLPRYRLAGADVGLRRGDRVVASYDEDSTTMAVAAGARALHGQRVAANLYFATSSPAYADKTNASAIHAALGLPYAAFATDLGSAPGAAGSPPGGPPPLAEVLPWPPTCASGDPVRPTNASAVMGPRHCCSVRGLPSPTSWPPPRIPPSSSTVGGHRGRLPASSGRSASAPTATPR